MAGSGRTCLPNTALFVQIALKGKTGISYPVSPPTRVQDGGKSPPATRQTSFCSLFDIFFLLLLQRKFHIIVYVWLIFPCYWNLFRKARLILKTQWSFEICTILKSLSSFSFFSSLHNNTPVYSSAHFASHWLSSFTNKILPNSATAQAITMTATIIYSEYAH